MELVYIEERELAVEGSGGSGDDARVRERGWEGEDEGLRTSTSRKGGTGSMRGLESVE